MEKIGIHNRKTVISEVITHGRELADELKKQLYPTNDSKVTSDFLLEEIMSTFDNALALLRTGYPNSQYTDTPIEDSPRNFGSDPDCEDHIHKHVSKKRKTLGKWSEQVRVYSETLFEGQIDDGYNWRKYGQKDILGSNHPRAYYRCTYRHTQGCLATKHIQRTNEDPSISLVSYRGKHSCMQEMAKQNKEKLDIQKNEKKSENMIIGNEPWFKLEIQELVVPKKETFLPLISVPSTPIESDNFEAQIFSELSEFDRTSYLSESYFSMNDFGIGHIFPSLESDFTEIVSDSALDTNFSLGKCGILIDHFDFGSHSSYLDYFS